MESIIPVSGAKGRYVFVASAATLSSQMMANQLNISDEETADLPDAIKAARNIRAEGGDGGGLGGGDGGVGSDQITGGAGVEVIHGGSGDDTISGGQGLDSIYGEGGDDERQWLGPAGGRDDATRGGSSTCLTDLTSC